MKTEFKIGEKIKIDSFLKRKSIYEDNIAGWRNRKRVWVDHPCKQIEGVVIGVRTLKNGTAEYDNEVGWMFSPTEHFKALLVAYNIHKNPVLVRIS